MTGASEVDPAIERRRELKRRVYAAAALAPVALLAAWFGGAPFILLLFLSAMIVLLEWRRIVGRTRWTLSTITPVAGLVLVAAVLLFVGQTAAWMTLVAAIAVSTVVLLMRGRGPWFALGLLYAGVFLLAVAAVRGTGSLGAVAMFWLLATVWAADTSAYFVGRKVGGPKLWPRVSPSKTWSGALGGLGGALISGVVFLLLTPASGAVPFLFLTAIVAIASMGGDLLESSVKRRFDVKDASRLIPGHGGLMDRVDSLVAAAVVAALVGLIRNPDDIPAALVLW